MKAEWDASLKQTVGVKCCDLFSYGPLSWVTSVSMETITDDY